MGTVSGEGNSTHGLILGLDRLNHRGNLLHVYRRAIDKSKSLAGVEDAQANKFLKEARVGKHIWEQTK